MKNQQASEAESLPDLRARRQSILPSPSMRRWEEATRSPLVWLLFSILCGLLDYWSGPILHFQIAYALPIAMAAWHRGLRWAIPMAIGLSCLRLAFLHHESLSIHWGIATVNLAIRMSVLASLAFLVHHTSRLATRAAHLEGLLPVCAWCKRIRGKDHQWVSLEVYLATQAEVVMTHGICPDCGRELKRS